MKRRWKWKRDRFLCWLLDHKWHDATEEEKDHDYFKMTIGWTLLVCLRCAETKRFLSPPNHPNCRGVLIPDDGITGPDPEPPSRWIN